MAGPMMRAAVFRRHGGPEVLEHALVPAPRPAHDEVLIDVHACGINHSDLDSRAGTSRWQFELPFALGAEFAGTVRELGDDVRGVRVGQPVTALQQYSCGRCRACTSWRQDLCAAFTVFGTDRWGGYAEQVAVPARALVSLASEDQFVVAAAAQTVVSTAWHMTVALAQVRAGETVLVPSASGGVAGALVQCAKRAGARVIATVGSPAKLDAVADLGADEVFCHRDSPVGETVARLTGGRGVDAVLDTVGGPLFGEHLGALTPDGRLATCGAHAGERVELDVVALFQSGRRILGFRVATPDEIEYSLQLALSGVLRVPIHATYGFDEAAQAHRALERREHVGKLVMVRR
ncbi:alcohol dehydrogenase catalytic domain-containing protein [Conexibacter sp. CPCC 206217]|uniref:zinc-binding dehydrogenase n=1 Tax=Conexibacter sp. CPCC 206217 TaxID=3064574 RepID=UPI00271F67CF|nr:alcohol dehydrogenase catalytic domain-containing protein [Conexibacter sp. CPCC 206217]MDO8212625.1 alcohol dehydrogenase catalytic domain-containing protein [Conexibacter sp. CPCC 206217]